MHHSKLLTFLFALFLMILFHPLLPAPGLAADCEDACQTPVPDDLKISEEKAEDGRIAVRAVFFIQSKPDLVYEILKDAVRFPEFMPDTREVTVIESGPGYHVARFAGGNGVMQSKLVMKRVFSEAERRISWTQVEGSAREVKGSWVVREENGGSRVTYWSYVDAGALVPDALVRSYQKESIPPMVANLRLRAQSGGTWKSENYLKSRNGG